MFSGAHLAFDEALDYACDEAAFKMAQWATYGLQPATGNAFIDVDVDAVIFEDGDVDTSNILIITKGDEVL